MDHAVPMFKADWINAVFIHFRIDPQELQPHVPFELDTFDGDAYVSIVAFTQSRLRPASLGRIGEILSTPLACHEFLNLRTYVRQGEEAGIYFLTEWIPNRLAWWIGPEFYGLPYRLGRLRYDFDALRGEAVGRVGGGGLSFVYRASFDADAGFGPSPSDSLVHFLVERYTAWTWRRGVCRRFRVRHEPWAIAPAQLRLVRTDLFDSAAPWLRGACLACAQVSPGVREVCISAPQAILLPAGVTKYALNRACSPCR